MKNTKFIIYGCLLYCSLLIGQIFAADYAKISCNGLPSSETCNWCFDGGGIYEGYAKYGIYDRYKNDSNDWYVASVKDNTISTHNLQTATNWTVSNPLFTRVRDEYNCGTWNGKQECFSGLQSNDELGLYRMFAPNHTSTYIKAQNKDGLQLTSIGAGAKRDKPGYVIKINLTTRKYKNVRSDPATRQECFYYYPNRCGDGVTDSDYGEKCDLGAKNGQPGSTCSSTCTKITPPLPACNNKYNEETHSSLTSGNHLCDPGTVGNFTETSTGRTWKCNGQAGTIPAQCSAIKPPPAGIGIIEKTLISPALVTQTGEIVRRKITVTASGGAISGFHIIEYIPSELQFSGVSKITSPITIPNYNHLIINNQETISRQIMDTLVQGEKIEIEIDTILQKLPQPDETITNIACVTQDQTERCDSAGTPSIEKTLIGSGIITHTGETVEWKITVKANSGQISNFKIKDTLPEELAYSGWSVTAPKSVNIGNPTGTGGKTITRNVSGTLAENETIILQITTKVVKMPKPNTTVKNIACLIKDNTQTCDEAETKEDDLIPDPRIKKTFIDGTTGGKTYHPGDLVGYKISFGNNGSGAATGIVIKDFLPKNLDFVSSQLFYTPSVPYTGYFDTQRDTQVEEYYNMTIPPQSSGYFFLTGRVLETNRDHTMNCVHLYSGTHSLNEECVLYTTDQPSLSIDKTVNKSVANIDEKVIYTIRITNNGKTPLSGFSITDTLPNGLEFIEEEKNHQFSGFYFDRDNNTLTRDTYQGTLEFQEWIEVNFQARVTQTGTHTNYACITHPSFPLWGSYPFSNLNCNAADVEVKEPQYCDTPIVSPKVIWADNKGEGSATVTCETLNGGNANIKIDCGNGTGATKDNVSSFEKICYYKLPQTIHDTYLISCTIDQNSVCTTNIEMRKDDRPDIGYCGDGKATDWEDCDCMDESKNCSLSSANIAPRAQGNYDNAICKNCKIVTDNNSGFVTPITCFNVNNDSISINKGEMLPFYRNIGKVSKDYYTTLDIDPSNAVKTYDNYKRDPQSCYADKDNDGKNDNDGKIAINAMVCNFKVYNRDHIQSKNDDYVYQLRVPCFTNGTNMQYDRSRSSLISDFINQNQKLAIEGNIDTFRSYNIFGETKNTFRSSVFLIQNFGNTSTNNKSVNYRERTQKADQINTFGEYKLSLDSVEYLQCREGQRRAQEPYPRVCEVNFTVTDPYILQKTPSGTINSTTTNLGKYKMMDRETDVMTYSELNKILTVSKNTYSDTTQIRTAMDAFINKYSKLAVKVNSTLFGSNSVKKVPGKHIYFVDGSLTINGGDNNAVYKTPFTIIQTNGDTIIKGNLNHNMMLLSNGSITIDGSQNCSNAQTLRGIYYTKKGFISTGVSKNDNLDNKERCIGGNLHIKGIAIGDGLNKVMESRRSELNQWFTCNSPDLTCKTQRRNYIMNGAAVLIEYSPSIFTAATMPPGAEEFAKALDVYKK